MNEKETNINNKKTNRFESNILVELFVLDKSNSLAKFKYSSGFIASVRKKWRLQTNINMFLVSFFFLVGEVSEITDIK